MESKKDIYSSWVQYTTKNEEVYFRHFIKGFVSIWESQLPLDWAQPQNMPDWTEAKSDAGPHLSRLPEELLPAIGKFLFIAKDNAEKNALTIEDTQEVELLIRCLIMISRNFDNIHMLASCDYIGLSISIASVLLHQLVAGKDQLRDVAVSYCTYLCHLLECLYDPYFTWRHFKFDKTPEIESLIHHPAALHVEVIPFIYDCFETCLIEIESDLSNELLNVLGASISGSQSTLCLLPHHGMIESQNIGRAHNALRSICPATASLVVMIVSNNKANLSVRITAAQCFTIMVHILIRSPPHQRQIEVGTLVELYRDALVGMVHEDWSESQITTAQNVVKTLKKAIIGSAMYALSIQGVMVNVHMLENLLNIIDNCSKSQLSEPLVVECVSTISAILIGASLGKEKMQRIDGYSTLFSSLHKIEKPSRNLLEGLLTIATENYSLEPNCYLKNPEVLVPLIKWIVKFNEADQLWLSQTLHQLCTRNLQSKTSATSSGAVLAILNCLFQFKDLSEASASELIRFLESLVSHSVTVAELKHIFLLLREEDNTECPFWEELYHALSNIVRNSCRQQLCHNYFDIQTAADGIIIPDLKKWANPGSGLSFHCWLRLDVLENPEGPEQLGSSSYRRQLFNLMTENNTGMEAFFCSNGMLVIGVNTRKEFLAAAVPDFSWVDGQWHCLDIVFTSARRPFGHNHLSVFIDGSQALSAALKFSVIADPFLTCKIGCVPEKTMLRTELKIDQRSVLGQDKSFLPSFITQVPSYFTLPLRSSAPLDPHVKNFPPGMQDTLYGKGAPLQAQLGVFCLLQEPLSSSQIKLMYETGPNSLHLFAPNGPSEFQAMYSNLVWAFSPIAAYSGQCLDLSGNNYEAIISAFLCHTCNIKNVINSIGSLYVTFPLLEKIGKSDGLDLSLVLPSNKGSASESHSDEIEDWVVLPTSAISEGKLEANPVSRYLILLKNFLKCSMNNQEKFLKNNGSAILGDIFSKISPDIINVSVLTSLQLLLEMTRDTPNPLLVKSLHQYLVFNFSIWTRCTFIVRICHLQFISTIIKDDRKYFRKKHGIQFLLDTIRQYYSQTGVLSLEDSKTIRVSILGLVKYYIQKEVSSKEVSAILGFLVACKEETLVIELLEMIIVQLESKHCRDQIYLLLYESHNAVVLYCLLFDKNFSMELKQKVLKLLSVLLRTTRVYERNKAQLRLQDFTSFGMYPGLISLLPDTPLSMEVTIMLLDQILMIETSGGYAGALSLLQSLQLADLEIKLEVARKVLAVVFMKPSAPKMFAAQIGWQDCITRLLVRCPISVPQSSSTPDLMVFDETEIQDYPEIGQASVSTTSMPPEAAPAGFEVDIKEVAETVSHAVADNISFAANNISSAVASAYSVIRQKTVEVQESLETLGETARMRAKAKESTSSLEQIAESETARNVEPPVMFDLDSMSFENRSPSVSSNEDLSSVNQTTDGSSSKDSVSLASAQSHGSFGNIKDDDDDDDEDKVLFDVLQQWKAMDAEKEGNREDELCYLVVHILFTVMWRGVDGSHKNCWKERGQVMACINLLALNNALYCSHLELKLRILEMLVQAALSDHRESTTTPENVLIHSENSAQLIRWVYDLTVLDPSNDDSKKASTKLLDGVFGLLDALLVFQENPSEEWREMAQLAFGILLSCAGFSQLEICAMATAKLNSLIMTRPMSDADEGSYLLFTISSIIKRTLNENNQEHYSFLIPVMKALIEKLSVILHIPMQVPNLPRTQSGPLFYDSFQQFCLTEEWKRFVEKKVRPLHEAYQAALTAHLTEAMNTFWAECYEGSKFSSHKRNREVGESKLRFQSSVVSSFRCRASDESVRFANVLTQQRNTELAVRRKWRMLKEFLYGPRGAWMSRTEPARHWKLSHYENFSRMRLKLCLNHEFHPHTDASNLRDNTGWLSRVKSGDVPLSLHITQAAVRTGVDDPDHFDEDLISLPQQDAEGLAEFDQNEDSGKEKLLMSQEGELVTLMRVVKGRLDISTTHLYFHDLSPVKEDVDRHDFKWSLSKLREVFLRRYNLRRSALEFFLTDQTNYFLNFTPKIRNRVVSRLLSLRPPNLSYHSTRSPSDLLRMSGLTQKWVNHEITNFDYLMQLNTIAGRTYNDLSQYPVFPWILADYTSETLDLSNPATFRDLSRPIGVVNGRNEIEVRSKYENFEDPTGTIAKFHYGTHYSNSAGVLHYLVRVEPFTSLHIELQSGRFDVADRQFHSIPQTWKLLMDSPNDVKELIPEFFYFPEFLKNMNRFDLGHLQGSKEKVDDVVLPKWADSAEDFIFKHRKALESEYVSANLHKWIDLIFGYKQKGPEAVEALNVFFYCSYEGAVDLDAITDPMEREAVEGMINNFGQTPTQLLREPHPLRLSTNDALTRMLRSDLRKPDLTMFLDKLATCLVPVSSEKDSLVFVSVPRSPPRGFLQTIIADCLITISKSGLIGQHAWLPHDRHSAKGFALDIDSSLSNPKFCRCISGSFHPSVTLNNQMFALSHDGKYLLSAGHWDSSIKVYSLIKGKTVISLVQHQDIVTCLALDACGWYLVSGSKDCSCIIWDIGRMPSVSPKALATLCGHDQPITSVAIATELDMVVSGSMDGTVNVYTINGAQFIRTISPLGCNLSTTQVTSIALSFQGHLAFSARDTTSGDSVHVYSVNGENLGSKLVSGRVTGLATVSHCLVVVDDAGDLTMSRLLGLHPVYDVPLHVPIQGIVVTNANTHMLIPLRDGSLAVIGLPNTVQKP